MSYYLVCVSKKTLECINDMRSFELTRQMNTGGSTNELIIRHLNSELFLMFKNARLMNLGFYGIKNTRQMNSVNKFYKIYPTNELTFYKNKKK